MRCRSALSYPAAALLLPLLLAAAGALAGCAAEGGDSGSARSDSTGGSASRAATDTASFRERFAAPIEEALADSVWRRKEALAAGLTVHFGGRTSFDGQMLMQTDMGRVRMEMGGDTVAVYDGKKAWVAPDSAALPGAYFALLTWPYFASVAHKLRDPGTHLADRGRMPVQRASISSGAAAQNAAAQNAAAQKQDATGQHTMMPAARMTFAPGTGDTPDDWYVLYRDPQTKRLAAMGYVVTYGGRSADEATPHAIVYGGYRPVDGVPIPTEWTFYHWTKERGPHGEPIGHVTLRDPHFTTPSDSAFAQPPGAEPSSSAPSS